MTDVLRAPPSPRHAFVEIYRTARCSTTARFFALTEKDRAVFNRIPLVQGEPVTFGPDGEHGVARAADGRLVESWPQVATTSSSTTSHRDDPAQAFAIARLAASPNEPTPIGVFRAVERPVRLTEVSRALAQARESIAGHRSRRAARRRHLDRQRLRPAELERAPRSRAATGRPAAGRRCAGVSQRWW